MAQDDAMCDFRLRTLGTRHPVPKWFTPRPLITMESMKLSHHLRRSTLSTLLHNTPASFQFQSTT